MRWRQTIGRWGMLAVLLLAGALECARAAPMVQDVSDVNFGLEEDQWVMEIAYDGRFSHWSMIGPVRIVVDLIGARSRLPQAPSLYEVDFRTGPVKTLRTSQYNSEPGKERVRFTLVLAEPLRYDILQEDGVLRLALPWRGLAHEGWVINLDHAGMREQEVSEPEPEPEPVAVEEPPPIVFPTKAAEVDTTNRRWIDGPLADLQDDPERAFDARMEDLLADTTFFEMGRTEDTRTVAWNTAAARLLGEAQRFYLSGDTATCLDRLLTTDRFYPETKPGRQAALLRALLLRSWGRVVEAELGSKPPKEGYFPLLADEVLTEVLDGALAVDDLGLAGEALEIWLQADPNQKSWAMGALRLAEALIDDEKGAAATDWIGRAVEIHPDLQASPRALYLLGMARMEERAWDEAEDLMLNVQATGGVALAYRALAARADIRYQKGAFSDAMSFYKELLADDVPAVEMEWALFQVGNCWVALGDFGKAKAYFTYVIENSTEGFWVSFARLRILDIESGAHVASSP